MLLDQNGYHDVPPGKLAAVVTYLEMTVPPERPPSPERPDLGLAPLPRHDLAGYRDLYRRVGADWLWFSRLLMPDERLRAILEDPAVEAFALRRDGRPIGLLELDGRRPGEVELAFFGLVSEAVGTGAGRWLMDRAVELAFAKRPRRFWVHTCTLDHPAALPFYIRSGFRPYGRAVEIADDPRLAGALPRDAAPSIPLVD
jgi:GNAT superfamily N-acetyltransferase